MSFGYVTQEAGRIFRVPLSLARGSSGRLLGGLAATLPRGAAVGHVAAGAHVVPDAAVVTGAVVEAAAAQVVLAGLQARPDPGVLGAAHLECDRSEQQLPAAALGFKVHRAVRPEACFHGHVEIRQVDDCVAAVPEVASTQGCDQSGT